MAAEQEWYIVTGANAGIGRALVLALARRRLPVIMACRDLERSAPVREAIVRETGNPLVELLPLDLGSLRSVEHFAGLVREQQRTVGALINNAGAMAGEFRTTGDGLEEDAQVNYMAPYLLTRLLLPVMKPGGRIVNTLSCTWRIGRLDDGLLHPDPTGFTRFGAYARSKLALLLFTLELSDRVRSGGIHVYAADPGVVSTGMIRMGRWFDPLADLVFRPLIRTPEKGAETALWLALGKAEAQYPVPVAGVSIFEYGTAGHPPKAGLFQKQEKCSIYYYCKKARRLPDSLWNHPRRASLWDETEKRIAVVLGHDPLRETPNG